MSEDRGRSLGSRARNRINNEYGVLGIPACRRRFLFGSFSPSPQSVNAIEKLLPERDAKE